MINPFKGVGRNDPCPCGSGKKFKTCCLNAQSLNEPSSALPRLHPAEQERGPLALEQADETLPEYDAFVAPNPDQWLALDEEERIELVVAYHRRARIRFPRERLHAVIHVMVENQIADAELPVRRTLERLMSEGLDRHDAIHAVGSVLIGYLNDLMHEVDSGGSQDAAKSDLERTRPI